MMSKRPFIDPDRVRQSGFLKFQSIPVNRYQLAGEQDVPDLSERDFLQVYEDMLLIREFELMIEALRTKGHYQGIDCSYNGPAHLSVGQEATAVGMAYELGASDFLFGSHRSHGEILAKGLSVIHHSLTSDLLSTIEHYQGGKIYHALDHAELGLKDEEKPICFLIYGLLSEILGRSTGFNGGIGGSMHAFFTPWGIYPNNAIVGASVSLAVGAALSKKVHLQPGVVVASIGDASLACGPVWEALMFAAMDQFRLLWDEQHRGGLPLIVNVVDNQYGMGSRTCGETAGYQIPARIGAALNPEQFHAERIDGCDPLAVIDAYRRKRRLIAEGKGPVLLDVLTYRLSSHSGEDSSAYRSSEEEEAWRQQDPLSSFQQRIVKNGYATKTELEERRMLVRGWIRACLQVAVRSELSPDWAPASVVPHMEQSIFPGYCSQNPSASASKPAVYKEMAANSRVQELHRIRQSDDDRFSLLTISDVLFESVLQRCYQDSELIVYGEECRDWGGAFGVYRGLKESLPYHRLFNTSISEAAIVGSAVGYAMCGGKVLIEIMYADFLTRAADELMNQLPKWQGMSAGQFHLSVIIRIAVGQEGGPQHAQDWSGLLTAIPGLQVVYPVTPYDAKGLLNTAFRLSTPVLFFESQQLYQQTEIFHRGEIPGESYEIPFGEPACRREGTDLTILTVGAVLYRALEAAEQLTKRWSVSAEVIDIRSLVPLNYGPLVASVKKTGRVLIVGDAAERSSFLKELAANLTQLAFHQLKEAPVVVGARDWIVPRGGNSVYCFPQKETILDAVHQRLLPLTNYQVTTEWSDQRLMREKRNGF